MKKILYILTSKFFWAFVGLVCLSLLVWFYGSIISIGEAKPFESYLVRIIVILLLVGIVFGRFVWQKMREARINNELLKEIKASQKPMLKHEKENSHIRQQFDEIDTVLKSAKFNNNNNNNKSILSRFFNGQYLYQMPWYVVLGASSSGKTTTIKQSGLNFPLESNFGSSINGFAGTKDCAWFLSDEAVWLDTAGRLSQQDSNHTDFNDWQEFIEQLQRYRPKQPINGVVVTVGVDELLNLNDNSYDLSMQLRKRINEMRTQFGINFPVYLIVTKLDLLKGFDEFFKETNLEHQKQSLGFHIPENKLTDNYQVVVGYIAKQLDVMKESLDGTYLQLMKEIDSDNDKDALFAFSDDFSVLGDRLIEFFDGLYKSSKFEEQILWRGIYFTSAVQEGETFDPYLTSIVNDFELTNKYQNNDIIRSDKKSFFIHNLMSQTIVNEAELAGTNTSWSYHFRSYRWIPFALTGAITLGIGYILISSCSNNAHYLEKVDNKAQTVEKTFKQKKETLNIVDAIQMAEEIKQVSEIKDIGLDDLSNPPYNYKMGLYQGQLMMDISESTYHRALRETVLPMIHHRIDYLLRQSLGAKDMYSYDALKAYIMLYDSENYDKEFIKTWILKDIDSDLSKVTEDKKKLIDYALDYILSADIIGPSLPYDAKLVREVRQKITKHDLANMILQNTYHHLESKIKSEQKSQIKPISFLTMGGNGTRRVFATESKASLSTAIDFRYTRDVYNQYVLPELKERAKIISEEEGWILDEYSSKGQDQKKTLQDAKQAYYRLYIEEWDSYLSDLDLNQPKNLEQAREYLKVLSDEYRSPLKRMILAINYNTSLGSSNNISDKISKGLTATKNKITNKTNQILGVNVGAIAKKAKSVTDQNEEDSSQVVLEEVEPIAPETETQLTRDIADGKIVEPTIQVKSAIQSQEQQQNLVAEYFLDYSNLVGEDPKETPKLDDIISSITGFYEYIDELNFAIDKGVKLPDTKPVMQFRTEISHLPTPFQGIFDNLSDSVLELWTIEKNRRQDKKNKKEQALKDDLKAEREKDKAEQKKIREEDKAEQKKMREEEEVKQEEKEQKLKEEEKAILKKIEIDKEKRMLASVANSLQPISKLCKQQMSSYYPFVSNGEDISFNAFTKMFGTNGYPSVDKLSPQAASMAGVNSLNELVQINDNFAQYHKVNQLIDFNKVYFSNKGSKLGFDVKVKVLKLDAKVDKLTILYAGKKYNYSHGPLASMNVNWPVKKDEFIINLYKNERIIKSITKKGSWSLFRMIEQGNIVKSSNSTSLVNYNIKGYNFALEFKNNSVGNPFDIKRLRKLQCL